MSGTLLSAKNQHFLMRIIPFLFIGFALLQSSLLFGQVVINEVHVKPAPNATGADIQSLKVCAQPTYGTEFIELYNSDPCLTVDVSCFILASSAFSGATNGSFRFPSGTTIPPQGHISIGGPNSGATFNLTAYCGDPHLLTGNDRWYLANGDMYLALYDDQGVAVNAVYWTSNAGEGGKWGTDTDLDEAPQYIPSGISCPVIASLPMPTGVEEYAGGSPAMGNSLSRTTDGAATWTELTPSINTCNDGNCAANGSFGVSSTISHPTCESTDGSISLTPDVAGTYLYTWTPNVSSTSSASNLAEGSYHIFVSDGFCSWDSTIVLTAPTPFSVSGNVTRPSCFGQTGSISLTPDGAGPYTYSWTPNVSSSNVANNLSAGSYHVEIDDGNCSWDSTILISSPPQITFQSGSTPTSCPTVDDGTAFVFDTTGGTGALTITWTSPGSNNDTIYNLSDGGYSFEIEDENGCKESGSVTVDEGTGPTITTDEPEYFACPGEQIVITAGGANTYAVNPPTGFTVGPPNNRIVSNDTLYGTFWMVGTDVNGCKDSVQFTLTRHDVPDSAEYTLTDATCNQSNGVVEVVQVFGGTPVFTYDFNSTGNVTNTSFPDLAASDYPIKITDANDCVLFDTVRVSNANGISGFTTSSESEICDQDNGRILVGNPQGGVAPYSYQLGTSAFQDFPDTTFSGLDSGTYVITVRDGTGCTTTKNVRVNWVNGPSLVAFELAPEFCDLNNGKLASLSVTDGLRNYEYQIGSSAFQTDTVFSGLDSGAYTLQVRDANGCELDTVFTIDYLVAPTISVEDSTLLSCFQSNDGDITVSATGTGPLSYSWNTTPEQTTPAISGLSAGTYNCIVTDTNQCTDNVSVTLTQPALLRASLDTTLSECTTPTGTATAHPVGGTIPYSFSWNTTPVQTSNPATGLTGGKTYQLTLTDDNNCRFDTSFTIGTVGGPTIVIDQVNNITCYDSTNGSIITAVSGGTLPYAYNWTAPPSTASLGSDSAIFGLDVGTGTSKNYQLVVTDDAGCVASISPTITKPDTIQAILTPTPDPCNRGIGQITVNGLSGGTGTLSYLWDDATAQTSQNATSLDAGDYQLVITDANNCTATFAATVNHIPAPIITTLTPQNVHCEAGNDGQIAVTATGSASLTYNWRKMPIPSAIIGTNDNINSLDTGRYVVTVTDANSCSVDSMIVIGFNHPIPVFDLGQDTAFCENDSVMIGSNSLTADSYLWNTGATTGSIYAKTPGEYRLEITRNGCTYEDTLQVREDQVPTFDLGEDSVFCGAVMITLSISVSGQPQYVWSNGHTGNSQTITIPDEYWAEVSRNTCIYADTILLEAQPETSVSLPNDQIFCEGDQYEIIPTVSNGEDPQYQWSNSATTESITVTQSGNYILTVTDGKCVASDAVQVTFLEVPEVNLPNDTTICENDELVITLPATSFSIEWNTGNTTRTETVTQAGNYSVVITNQICSASDDITVLTQAIPVFELAPDTSICQYDEITIGTQVANVDTYSWNTGETSPYIISEGGSHTLTVTENGCSYSDEMSVFNLPLPEIPDLDTKKCKFDTIFIDATCFDCVSYQWDTGDTLSTLEVPHPIVTEVTATNSHGCQTSKVVVVQEDRDPYCVPQFYVPNTFTPEGDGYNEIFLPIFSGPELLSYELSIYNRWGERIFQTNNLQQGWDGNYKNYLSQTGIYNWVIRYKIDGEAVFKKFFGKVNLFR